MNRYEPNEHIYDQPEGWFHNFGRAGLGISPMALSMWHNFGVPATGSLGLNNGSDSHETV